MLSRTRCTIRPSSKSTKTIKNAVQTSFLHLPAEIRIVTYNLVIPEDLFCEIRWKQKSTSKSDKHNKRVARQRFRLCSSFETMEDGFPIAIPAMALLCACRQVNEDIIPILYGKLTFGFESSKLINSFLNCAPYQGKECLAKLSIFHQTYGEPGRMEDRKWKLKSDENWLRTCWRVREELKHVQVLEIVCILNEWPIQLALGAAWTQPFMTLRSLRLNQVTITLGDRCSSKERLSQMAKELEGIIIGKDTQKASTSDYV